MKGSRMRTLRPRLCMCTRMAQRTAEARRARMDLVVLAREPSTACTGLGYVPSPPPFCANNGEAIISRCSRMRMWGAPARTTCCSSAAVVTDVTAHSVLTSCCSRRSSAAAMSTDTNGIGSCYSSGAPWVSMLCALPVCMAHSMVVRGNRGTGHVERTELGRGNGREDLHGFTSRYDILLSQCTVERGAHL